MKIDTYHEALEKILELTQEANEQDNKDIAKALDDVRERLNFCWSKTVEREVQSEED